jgi:ammonia channel protein AmtB
MFCFLLLFALCSLGMINGAIAGLVCITPAAGYVDMTGAFFIGFFGGPLCYMGAQLKHYLGKIFMSCFYIYIKDRET